jgi:imidazolonepropionase-like amidohydrolase
MTVMDGIALNVVFPTAAGGFGRGGGDPALEGLFGGRGLQKRQRDEKVKRLRELFAQAIAYDEGRKLSPSAPSNPRLEAVVPFARGEKPVVIQASRKADILEALKLADELKLKVIISGATDAWRVTDELKKRDVPVMVGPIMAMPQEREELYDAPFTNPAKLHEAGVKFCIRTGVNGGSNSGSSNTRNLPYEAAYAVSYGLPEDEGLKAITLYPAQILGAEKEIGSIDVGKRANLVLSTGNPMQASSQVQAVFVDGKAFEPTSKQTRLYDRYKERLREVQEGRSPLGTK